MTPGTYRPTTLKLAARHCPRAVDYYEQGQPGDRRIYDTGTAAHAVLQALREAANQHEAAVDDDRAREISMAVVRKLIEVGRTFDGDPEPPMNPDAAWEGQRLALSWHAQEPIQPGPTSEVGLAVDEAWRPVSYSKGARLRLIADTVETDIWVDEEAFLPYVAVEDYKTAWSTDAGELDTLQLRAQAVLAWLHYGQEAELVIRRVTNLRTRKTYEHRLTVQSEEGQAMLKLWQRQLAETMEALDAMRSRDGSRPARPGGGCIGCPYFGACPHGQDYVDRAEALGTPAEMARGYMAAKAAVGYLQSRIKQLTDHEPLEVDGWEIGTFPQERRRLSDEAYAELADSWKAWGGDLRGFALAVGLGASNLDAFCKVRFKETADSEEEFRRRVEGASQIERRFGYRRKE